MKIRLVMETDDGQVLSSMNVWTDKVEFTPEQAEKHAAEVIRATFGTRHTNGFVGMVPVQVAEA